MKTFDDILFIVRLAKRNHHQTHGCDPTVVYLGRDEIFILKNLEYQMTYYKPNRNERYVAGLRMYEVKEDSHLRVY